MAVVDELIRLEDNGTLSFGDYTADLKKKVPEFKVNDDIYYVKTFAEITRLEKNGRLLLESIPGSTVHNFSADERTASFTIEGTGDIRITMELEPESEYRVVVDDFNIGSVNSGLSGKVSFSVDADGTEKAVKLEKM
ncbi:endosialidase [Lachnospiraceae bacterium NSJ-143]|nr:endosialidase [Lachnospiraceae bacterium NSJ-143]